VHDELVLEVPDAELDADARATARLMAGVAQLSVPLVAEVGRRANWDDSIGIPLSDNAAAGHLRDMIALRPWGGRLSDAHRFDAEWFPFILQGQ
jgi:hypothetical protein